MTKNTHANNRNFGDQCRLHCTSEFSSVFDARQVLRGENFDLHFNLGNSASSQLDSKTRLGLVIAKKLARKAVQRNLLKRLAREAFRHAMHGLPQGDLVMRLSRSPGECVNAERRRLVRADLDRLLGRLKR